MPFPSGTEKSEIGGRIKNTDKHSETTNMFQPPTYQYTLNSITPFLALLSLLQIKDLLRLFFSFNHPSNSMCAIVVFLCQPLSGHSLQTPLECESAFKSNPLLCPCSGSQLVTVRGREEPAGGRPCIMNLSSLRKTKKIVTFTSTMCHRNGHHRGFLLQYLFNLNSSLDSYSYE